MTRLASFPAILIGLIVGSSFCSSVIAEVTEERRAVTRKQCAIEGDVAAVSIKMRLRGTSLEKGLEIIWSISDDEHPADTMELTMLDAYSFPSSNSENPASTTE